MPRTYVQEGPKKTVPWFVDGNRSIRRHPLNVRKTGAVTNQYKARILESGIVAGVRGEAWLQNDPDGKGYLALTFGTLRLS